MLVDNAKGNYDFVRGIEVFSSGAVAQRGFEIVHAALRPFVPLGAGYQLVQRHLREASRPLNALCGMELRIPRALSGQGFDEFNRPYIEQLKRWEVHVDGVNPVARTNVALEVNPVPEAVLAGFFYTIPSDAAAPTFVLAGSPEIRSRETNELVARGDTSPEGLRAKTQCVIEVLAERLKEMRLSWNDASVVNLYTVHDLHPLMVATLLPGLGAAARFGVNWHYARPPRTGLEVEIDAHHVRREVVIGP
jgi:hypothetical protein